MKPFRWPVWVIAFAVLAVVNLPAKAAWNNVFQVCCCNSTRSYSFAPPAVDSCCPAPCPPPCPQTTCTTQYVQRSYYQPVTTYRTRTWYEPVTTYRTSYYWEQCTRVRYSCYYDPCTCSYQQVATPVTSYRLRSRCCPVTSYLQRSCLQPVQSYRQVFYYEPVTTCATTPACPTNPPSVSEQPPNTLPNRPPSVSENPGLPREGSGSSLRQSPPPTMPPARDRRYPQQLRLYPPVPVTPSQPKPSTVEPPRVPADRLASRTANASLAGQVVSRDRVAQSGAQVLFVRADRAGRETITTDLSGRFRVKLASGNWLVYVQNRAGKPVFDRKLDVRGDQPLQLTLTSR
jgi:hypothetical protein